MLINLFPKLKRSLFSQVQSLDYLFSHSRAQPPDLYFVFAAVFFVDYDDLHSAVTLHLWFGWLLFRCELGNFEVLQLVGCFVGRQGNTGTSFYQMFFARV